jgi:hypothetical protein
MNLHRSWRRQDTFYAALAVLAAAIVAYVSASAVGVTPTPFAGSGSASVFVDVAIARPLPVIATLPQVAPTPSPAEVARGDSTGPSADATRPIATTTHRPIAPVVGGVAIRVSATVTNIGDGLLHTVARILAPSSNRLH